MDMLSEKDKIEKIISILEKDYPDPKVALNFNSPFELLVATILSAQCTDKRVNIVTEDLFKKYKSIEDFAKANTKELEKDIYSTGFYKNKAKNIILASQMIISDFGGGVPSDMSEIIKLPGVARKTANVVLSGAFGKEEGIAVDTHVKRISRLLDLTKNENPEKIEKDLMDNTRKKDWSRFSHLLIFHGRNTCIARRPKCEECKIKKYCNFYQNKNSAN